MVSSSYFQVIKFQTAAVIYTIFFLALAGCGSAPVKTTTTDEEAKIPISLEGIGELLDNADQQDNDKRHFIYLDVAQALIEADEIDWARNTLAQLNSHTVPPDQFIRYSVLSATVAIAEGQVFRAKSILWNTQLDDNAALAPQEERQKLFEMRARLLHSLGDYHGSIAQRIALSEMSDANTEEYLGNHNTLWQTLMELPFDELELESQIQNEIVAKGWYTLAALSKNNQTNIRQQVTELEQWTLYWPEHPASLMVPADLQLLRQLAEDQPSHIAVLLPFGGRFSAAADAVRDGIMAAYYDAASYEERLPDLRMYDTSTGQDINSIYDEAILQGAQLVIGPLEQGKIAELALRPVLPVPTLALNRLSGELDSSVGLFQFGLPLEDEAKQVADQAWRDGHRRAMILAPSSSNGDRSVTSFSEQWLSLGGEIVKDYRYKEKSGYSDLIKNAVHIQNSEERKNKIRSIIGQNIEFEPRRRKDVDFIFLYSQASQARQIKPILAFHYSGDIPVYAIKDIYNGKEDKKRDRDLNNIRFTTLPWFFEENLPEKRAIATYNRGANYQSLYALGVDAYHIHPRLRQLLEVKQAHFYGTTGKLSVDEKQKIKREQIWAMFENGSAVSVATFSSEDDL